MKTKWIIWGILSVAAFVLLFIYGCESQVLSLTGNGQKVNRAELNFELESYLRMAELRFTNLDKQDAVREVIFQNALLVFQTGGINPAGVATAVAAIYGIISGGTSVAKYARKKVINPESA